MFLFFEALTMLTNVALREHRPNRSDNGNQSNRERQTERVSVFIFL